MNEIVCQNCRYFKSNSADVTPQTGDPLMSPDSAGECRRRSPALGALGDLARWPSVTGEMWCWEWRSIRLAKPVKEPKIGGRPKFHSEAAVIEALSVMTTSDAPRSFPEVLALINIQLPMSRSVAYKFISGLIKTGFLSKRDGGFVRGNTVLELD